MFRTCPLAGMGSDSLLLQLMKQNALLSIHSSEPTLDDIFIEVTGKELV